MAGERPRRSFQVNGFRWDSAPRWLRSLCDCVDGAALAHVKLKPREIVQTWHLFRGGKVVGVVKKRLRRDE